MLENFRSFGFVQCIGKNYKIEKYTEWFKIENYWEFFYGIKKCQSEWLECCNKQSTSYDFIYFKNIENWST